MFASESNEYTKDWVAGVFPQLDSLTVSWELTTGNPFSYCFFPSLRMSSEILPRFKTNEPKSFEFDSFSENVSRSQNWINSTFDFSKLVEERSLVIPAQLSFKSFTKLEFTLLLYGPFSSGK